MATEASVYSPYNEGYAFFRHEVESGDISILRRTAHDKLYKLRCEHEIIRPLDLPPNARVLDVGSNTGKTMSCLIRAAGYTVIGIDLNVSAIRWGRDHYEGADKNFQASATSLPFPDQSFDAVVSSDLLEHLPPELVGQAFDEMVRVCRGPRMVHKVTVIEDRAWINADPTHQTKLSAEWWKGFFVDHGWKSVAKTRRYCDYRLRPFPRLYSMNGYFFLERM